MIRSALATLLATCMAAGGVAAGAATAAPPSELVALAAAAHIDEAILHWCRVQLGAARERAYAVALRSPSGGGRYLVLGARGQAFELGPFAGLADLSCYTPAEARRLDRALQTSETLRGRIEPIGRSTVVCGFVEQTGAACWQYSATLHSFVRVGDWLH